MQSGEHVREQPGGSVGTQAGKRRASGRDDDIVAHQGVFMFDLHPTDGTQPRLQHELIVVPRGGFVTDVQSNHGEKDALGLQFPVTDAGLSKKLGPPHLEPDRKGRVMSDSHGITFAVAGPDVDAVHAHVIRLAEKAPT